MAKKKRGDAHGGGHGWFVTFADLMGLMMSFFVMLVAFSTMDNNKLKINEEDATWDTLGPRLNDIFKLRAEKVAFVKGDDTVIFSQVAQAIDIMRASGIDKVGLITARLEAGQ